ncbi:AAA family ATPase [Kineothrix sp. MB12-C1]|uniref:AAA family ATPase n=1 Tax=Kineothrix sp. MB12-C1 TaxID=3070215 RepID=UPI0027D1F52F|nr:hypothetical protein [Kineothrix sp. MB12-C1]WMC91087.1 hypothetical protein RBB56_09295 [Kineothrix sp. MB12-C1]
MLVKITVENFKSFNNQAELTMISSSKIRKNNQHKTTIKKINLLKSAVIYDANESGKSNLIEILRFMKFCVTKQIPLGAKQMYGRNRIENIDKEAVFEVQITKNNKFYVYGFSVILNKKIIISEWHMNCFLVVMRKCFLKEKKASFQKKYTQIFLKK